MNAGLRDLARSPDSKLAPLAHSSQDSSRREGSGSAPDRERRPFNKPLRDRRREKRVASTNRGRRRRRAGWRLRQDHRRCRRSCRVRWAAWPHREMLLIAATAYAARVSSRATTNQEARSATRATAQELQQAGDLRTQAGGACRRRPTFDGQHAAPGLRTQRPSRPSRRAAGLQSVKPALFQIRRLPKSKNKLSSQTICKQRIHV